MINIYWYLVIVTDEFVDYLRWFKIIFRGLSQHAIDYETGRPIHSHRKENKNM